MKTKNKLCWFSGAAALLVLLPVLPAADTAQAVTAPESDPPTHVLFTGADIQVHHRKAMHRVQGVEGDAFIINVENERVRIPMGLKPEGLKVSRVLRLTDRSAAVTKFKYDRAYTPGNDPVRKWAPAMAATAEMNAEALAAQNKLDSTPAEMTVRIGSGPPGATPMKSVPNPQYDVAQANALRASGRISGNMGSVSTYAEKIADEQAQELYDALDVQFEVSAAKPIRKPYLVVTAIYHEKDDPNYMSKWLFAKALDPIEAQPRTVYVREAGFPRGFMVKQLQVHLYEDGQEIPTDLSENRAHLTRDEAQEYLVIEHVSTHKEDTMPAKVAQTLLPADWAIRNADALFPHNYYAKVSKTGQVVGVFENEACTTKVKVSYVEAALKELLFLPALEKGKAIDSVVQINPVHLPL